MHDAGHDNRDRSHFNDRQLRLRVIELLEQRVKQFRTREELWPLRVPHEPLSLAEIVDAAMGSSERRFDPTTLRSRTVLQLEWEDGSTWSAWVILLPSKVKLFCDSGEEGPRVLASGGRNMGDESDRLFLTLLAESAGHHFGLELSGGVPTRIRSWIADREFLLDALVELFEVAGLQDDIRADLTERRGAVIDNDFRSDLDAWLDDVMR